MFTVAGNHVVRTAGVILRHEDRFVFQTGFDKSRTALGVVRLGGHVEEGETPTQCAVREVREEGLVDARLVDCATTYGYEVDALDIGPTPLDPGADRPRPLFISTLPESSPPVASVTFVADAAARPRPGAETQALLFLSRSEITRLASRRTSLGDFLGGGGQAHFVNALPLDLFLHPHGQLKALAMLLERGVDLPT